MGKCMWNICDFCTNISMLMLVYSREARSCVTRTSATLVWTLWDEQSQERISTTCAISVSRNDEHGTIYSCFMIIQRVMGYFFQPIQSKPVASRSWKPVLYCGYNSSDINTAGGARIGFGDPTKILWAKHATVMLFIAQPLSMYDDYWLRILCVWQSYITSTAIHWPATET